MTLDVIAVTAEGKRLNIAARIAAPARAADGSWACEVEVAPLTSPSVEVRGVDSFHAMWLACSLILKLLQHFTSQGGHLLNAGLTIALAAAAASMTEHPSTAAIVTLSVTVGTWIINFIAAVQQRDRILVEHDVVQAGDFCRGQRSVPFQSPSGAERSPDLAGERSNKTLRDRC